MSRVSATDWHRPGGLDHPQGKASVGRRRTFLWACGILCGIATPAAGLSATAPPVRIAYFIPSDREPIQGYRERLDRVLTEVQRFYRDGMSAAGFGSKTFALERDAQGALVIHLAPASHPASAYGRESSAAVRQEVRATLAKRQIDMDRDTWIIFQVLLRWEDGKAMEIGPYVGGGSHLSGTAWVYDDERLDPRLLSSSASGGYYGRPCSLGEFNSHYIGGLAHELGHAFGLPHDCQKKRDHSRGLSLMGGGNHVYGQELRGEGPGAFLTHAGAMLLAFSRPFAGEREAAADTPTLRWKELDAHFSHETLVLSGALDAQPAAFGIIAFDDWAKIPDNYDAVSWTCDVTKDGRFRLEIGELRPGRSQLRLWVCHTNGATSQLAFEYDVDSAGLPDLAPFRYRLPLIEAIAAYRQRDRTRVETLAAALKQRFPDVPEIQNKASHLLTLLAPDRPRPWGELPATNGWIGISRAQFRTATVGWGPPLRDQVLQEQPDTCFLEVGGQFFDRGLYAHAPARHELVLDGKATRFRSGYGLQDRRRGSVVFVVRGDGRELFRSSVVTDHRLRTAEVETSGIQVLELCVEDGGDGINGDWGVWLAPEVALDTKAETR